MVEKVRCHLTFRLHSGHVQSQGAGLGSMPHGKYAPRAPSRAEAGKYLSQFPVLKPGRAWLVPLWPNRGAGFGIQHITFGSSPHPSPGAYKRGSVEPLEPLLQNIICVRLPSITCFLWSFFFENLI